MVVSLSSVLFPSVVNHRLEDVSTLTLSNRTSAHITFLYVYVYIYVPGQRLKTCSARVIGWTGKSGDETLLRRHRTE